jgi:hypothetical protein
LTADPKPELEERDNCGALGDSIWSSELGDVVPIPTKSPKLPSVVAVVVVRDHNPEPGSRVVDVPTVNVDPEKETDGEILSVFELAACEYDNTPVEGV